MAGATLEPAGSGVAGVQPKGITQQYQLAATSANLNTSTGITPRDSGTIVINTNPGKPPQKQTNGTVQRSSQLKVDGTAGNVGNALVCTSGVGLVPTPPVGSTSQDGLSQDAQHQ